MSRPLRIEFEGALYHITAREKRQESIFYGDGDRYTFLRVLKKSNRALQLGLPCLLFDG